MAANPYESEIRKHLGAVGKNLDSFSSRYENFILVGSFIVEFTKHAMEEVVKVYSLKGQLVLKPLINLLVST